MLALHTTDTRNVDSIIKKGLICKDYPEHPVAKEFDCSTFLYPIDGVDQALKYWPQNARMRGAELDDSSYVIANIDTCTIGDLFLEGEHEKYKDGIMSSERYVQESNYSRRKFEEPEVVCAKSILPEKILGALLYSELNEINDKCMKSSNMYECMETSIRVKLKK